MKSKNLFYSSMFMCFLSLAVHAQNLSYHISGKLQNLPSASSKLYLKEAIPLGLLASPIDSSEVKNGEYHFDGKLNTDEPDMVVISSNITGQGTDKITLVVDKGKIDIVSDAKLSNFTVTGTGSLANQQFDDMKGDSKRTTDSIRAVMATDAYKTDKELQQRLTRKMIQNAGKTIFNMYSYLKAHPGNRISPFGTYTLVALPLLNQPGKDTLISLLPEKVKADKLGQEIIKLNDKNKATRDSLIKAAQAKAADGQSKIQLGTKATEITQNNPEGKPVSLSALKGKYVLVDFWASWCAPCRAENPNVVKLYKEYNAKGFTVFGVSLDAQSTQQAWMNAIEKDGMTWTQVSDLKGWANSAAKDGPDFDAASNAGGIMSLMGVGDLSSVQLDQALTGKLVHSSVSIGIRAENINAATTPQDIETALQLTYLQFTAPRKDELMFSNTIGKAIAGLSTRYNNPNQVFADTINYVMSGYSYRYAPPTEARFRGIMLNRVYDIYRERFADASNFTFVFVGNFEINKLQPLLERYLGSLPSTYKHTLPRDLGQHIPTGHLEKKVFQGIENKATVRVVLSGDYSYGPLANLQLKAITDILEIKILQRLREAEGEVYSPQVSIAFNKYPRNRFAVVIQFGCAPQNADHLVLLLEEEIKKLRENGPQPDDIEKFKAQYQKTVELALNDNNFWYNYLLNQSENYDDLLQVQSLMKNIEAVDLNSLKKAAQLFLAEKNVIKFELLPGVKN